MEKQIQHLKSHYQFELKNSFQLLLLAIALYLPFLFYHFLNLFGLDIQLPEIIQFILAAIIQFGLGYKFYLLAFEEIKRKSANFNVLIFLSTNAAFLLSVINYYSHPRGPLFFEISALIMLSAFAGRWIFFIFLERSFKKASKMVAVIPETAFVEKNGEVSEILIENLQEGDVFIVHPGAIIPADGVVILGRSHVDEALFSGEVMPKQEGSNLFAGTVNQENLLKAVAKEVGKKTTFLSIMQIFQKSYLAKVNSAFDNILDNFSSYYIPTVILFFCFVWLGWLGFELAGLGTGKGLINALAILTLACPVILPLTVFPVLMIAIKIGAANHIVFKDEFVIEKVAKVKRFLFDKIGVLTKGCPTVQHIQSVSKMQMSEILKIAASLASQSAHPASRAILKKAFANKIEFLPAKDFERLLGRAVKGVIDNQTYYLGSLPYAREKGIQIDANINPSINLETNLFQVEKKAKIILAIWNNEGLLGYIIIVDAIRESAPESILELKERRIFTTMLTEDQRNMAFEIAWQMNFLDFKFDLLPAEKMEEVIIAKKITGPIGMVGDGIYDAEALAQADISCLIGESRDKVVECADVTLVCKNLMCLIAAIDLSKKAMQKIKINIFLAIFCNILAVPLATFGLLDLPQALNAEFIGIVTVLANTLFFSYWKPKQK